jgi:hypothetical protein
MIIIKREDAKNIMIEIIKRLSEVEVKGESVEHLFMARVMLKQLLEASEEQQEKKEGG